MKLLLFIIFLLVDYFRQITKTLTFSISFLEKKSMSKKEKASK